MKNGDAKEDDGCALSGLYGYGLDGGEWRPGRDAVQIDDILIADGIRAGPGDSGIGEASAGRLPPIGNVTAVDDGIRGGSSITHFYE